jgi:hypothetical protein
MVEVIGDSANAEHVAHNLQVAADELMAMFNKTGMDRYDGYIRWVNSHVRILAGQISQRDIDALLQTRGYGAFEQATLPRSAKI